MTDVAQPAAITDISQPGATLTMTRTFALFTKTGLRVHVRVPKGVPGTLVVTEDSQTGRGGPQTWAVGVRDGPWVYKDMNARVEREVNQQQKMEKGIKIRDSFYEANPLGPSGISSGGTTLNSSGPARLVVPLVPTLLDVEKMMGEFEYRCTQEDRPPIPIPGIVIRRLLSLRWLDMAEVEERCLPIDIESLNQYDALCAKRLATGNGNGQYTATGEHPWVLQRYIADLYPVAPTREERATWMKAKYQSARAGGGYVVATKYYGATEYVHPMAQKGRDVCALKDEGFRRDQRKEERDRLRDEGVAEASAKMRQWKEEEREAAEQARMREEKAAMEEDMARLASEQQSASERSSTTEWPPSTPEKVVQESQRPKQGSKRCIEEVEDNEDAETTPTKRSRTSSDSSMTSGTGPASKRRSEGFRKLSPSSSVVPKQSLSVAPKQLLSVAPKQLLSVALTQQHPTIFLQPPPPQPATPHTPAPSRKRAFEDEEEAPEERSPKKMRVSGGNDRYFSAGNDKYFATRDNEDFGDDTETQDGGGGLWPRLKSFFGLNVKAPAKKSTSSRTRRVPARRGHPSGPGRLTTSASGVLVPSDTLVPSGALVSSGAPMASAHTTHTVVYNPFSI